MTWFGDDDGMFVWWNEHNDHADDRDDQADEEEGPAVPSKTETPYSETEALLAVMQQNRDRAREILDGFLLGELGVFLDQLDELADLAANTLTRKRKAGK